MPRVIQSFRSKETAKIFQHERSRKLPSQVQERALRKLQMLDAAERLENLAIFPGNQLEALKGDRAGQHSIRINDQWRICFVWRDHGAHEVEIVDYH
jgi:toxin HigB-1